jgi:hypothetical protein
MKIAIIGGGWIGCHLAKNLMHNHEVVLYEKQSELFTQTSFKNQNRLHYGYHYSRNSKTRELCRATFHRFLNEYESFTKQISRNYYSISNKSLIDYGTFLEIFKNDPIEEVVNPFNNLEGTVNTIERFIDFANLKHYFNTVLKHIIVIEKINDLNSLRTQFDWVINCTNNHLLHDDSSYFELTLTLLYRKIAATVFDSITIVDGDFFSIYPYDNKRYTITDVEHTPICKFDSINDLYKFQITDELVRIKTDLIQNKIISYFPDFLNHFEYDSYFTSVKSKSYSDFSGNRNPKIVLNDNIITCYTGKIQGIYLIHDYILNHIERK